MLNRLFSFVLLGAMLMTMANITPTQAGGDPLAGTQWKLISLGEHDLSANPTLTLIFGAENDLGGFGGCNSYGGGYSVDEDAFTVTEIATTLMACMDGVAMDNEQTYLAAMQTAHHYTLTDNRLVILVENDVQLVFVPLGVLTNTRWQLVALGGEPVQGDQPLTLLQDDIMHMGGYAGCNTITGTFAFDRLGNISFDSLASTRRACANEALSAQEQAYIAALESATAYEISAEELVITYGADNAQMLFNAPQALAGTQWHLETLNGEPPVADAVPTLGFESATSMDGHSGCNSLGGSYSTTDHSISIGNLVMTEMACLDNGIMEQEGQYTAALMGATTFKLMPDRLTINTSMGGQLVFTPAIALVVR